MSYDKEHGFVESVRRFFWLPGEVPRRVSPVGPLVGGWFVFAVVGAGFIAVDWIDGFVPVVVGTVLALLDDVIKGVRHRWPAFVIGLGVGWAVGRLVRTGVPAPADPDWASYPGLLCGSLAAFLAFAAITRLPEVSRAR
ncbi:hypothetical protein [Streptomyces sp. NBC_00620]|uniref:hypothetical protein n=1 Tax=unclassified Streptomyces TaxID=2593676 RepID=UPI0022541CD1|nr:hypothetical protein [Streptomyces sp. NBC_00620]MCX4971306.1 hypothetical protein [Streptomyces sp. NBC_00620]